ncbi:MAG TPA: YceD family protein [Ramlibacter sp.]|uniref:YceD family protein n=1 Tax=Ramlibacter sp. TaxID=1917967 RepID=UPI002D80B86E|nr:YceD family protein [Ramlibacter sp.]HET8749024.1 YceD family protein [Ramlibacter sp.]
MAKDFDPHRLDVHRFAEEGGVIDSSEHLRSFQRLVAETPPGADIARNVRWRARGELLNAHHLQPQVWVHLEADTTLPLVCQRCLTPVDVPVDVRRSFRFVADEATAAAEDDEAEEDLLALSRSFDLLELVEDELLMELPVAPRHDVCPGPVKMSVSDPDFDAAAAEKDNPFAVLGRLKPGK